MPTQTEPVALDADTRAQLLEAAETLAQPDGPLLDRRDEEVVDEIERMAELVN